jgi:hypothetical protein
VSIEYGFAEFDRISGSIGSHNDLPMLDVEGDTIFEYLRNAGVNGWELCAAFPSSIKGNKRAIGVLGRLRQSEDGAEEIAFIFKRVI